jgi:hypothetical protein
MWLLATAAPGPRNGISVKRKITMKVNRKTQTVTIYSLWTKHFPNHSTIEYSVKVPAAATTIDTLEKAFSRTNCQGRPRAGEFCSTTTGDVMELDGQYYLVEHIGFHALTQAEADAVIQLDCRDTCWGYDWLVNHHLLSAKA